MMTTEREKCLKQLSAAQFMVWELHLYLDTHPDDCEAKARHEKYAAAAKELKAAFEEKFGPLTTRTGTGEDWLKNPWPWDLEECVR